MHYTTLRVCRTVVSAPLPPAVVRPGFYVPDFPGRSDSTFVTLIPLVTCVVIRPPAICYMPTLRNSCGFTFAFTIPTYTFALPAALRLPHICRLIWTLHNTGCYTTPLHLRLTFAITRTHTAFVYRLLTRFLHHAFVVVFAR